jgi:hypothetical protein
LILESRPAVSCLVDRSTKRLRVKWLDAERFKYPLSSALELELRASQVLQMGAEHRLEPARVLFRELGVYTREKPHEFVLTLILPVAPYVRCNQENEEHIEGNR